MLRVPNAAYAFNDAYAIETLILGGTDISEYCIVLDDESREIAEYLQTKIREWTGHVLPLKNARADADVYEILVGNAARGENGVYPEGQQYMVQQVGPKLFLGGTTEHAGYYATMDFLNEYILKAPSASALTINADKSAVPFTTVPFGITNLPLELSDFTGKIDLEISAESAFQRFQLAKNELPEEITVLDPIDVSNYPLSLQKQVYVSAKKGDDANDGLTPKTPFETLQRAVSAMLGKGGGVIWMMEGTYELKETVTLSSAVSGTPASPLFIKAYEDKDVALTSNSIWPGFESGAWNPVSYYSGDEVADRIPDRVKDSGDDIYYATLSDLGLTKADMADITQTNQPKLYVGETAYTIARYPNNTGNATDLFYFTKTYDIGSVGRTTSGHYSSWLARVAASGGALTLNSIVGWQIRVINEKDNGSFVNSEGETNAQEMADEITSWVNTGNIWCYGSLYQGWETAYYNLSLNEEGVQNWHYSEDGERLLGGWRDDPNGITVTAYDKNGRASQKTGYYFLKSKHPCYYGCGPSTNSGAGRNTLYFFNAIEALDVPGEWFYEEETETVYLYPTDDFYQDEAVAFSGKDTYDLIKCFEAEQIIFDGIDINGTGARGININYGDSLIFQNCKFSNTGNGAIYAVNLTNSALIYNDFSRNYEGYWVDFNSHYTEESMLTLTPSNNFIQNCVFHDSIMNEDIAIFYAGVRTVISHNYFKNTVINTGAAVEPIVEYNRFDGGSKTMSDGGMIYFGAFSTRGAHARYNLCHMFEATHRGVYFDTQASGGYAYGNVISTLDGFTKATYDGWYSSSGNGNVCWGNIFILRNPLQCALSAVAGGQETGTVSVPNSGDKLSQSDLFYYYWNDTGFVMGNNPTHYFFSYKEVAEAGLLDATEAELWAHFQPQSDSSRVSFKQDEAGSWWADYVEDELYKYLTQRDTEAYRKRFPNYINSLENLKLVLEAYESSTYHIRYFYQPAELSGESYTYKTIEGAVFTIPEYQYKNENGETVTVPRELKYPTLVDGEWQITLTYEEIASIERMDRAPANCVIKDNIILGGTPGNLKNNSKPMSESNTIVDNSVWESSTIYVAKLEGFDPQKAVWQENNFLYFTYSDIIPYADIHEYEIQEEGWDLIRARMGNDFADIFTDIAWWEFGMSDPMFDYEQYEEYE